MYTRQQTWYSHPSHPYNARHDLHIRQNHNGHGLPNLLWRDYGECVHLESPDQGVLFSRLQSRSPTTGLFPLRGDLTLIAQDLRGDQLGMIELISEFKGRAII